MSVLFRREEQRAVSYQDVWGSGGPSPLTANSMKGALSLVPVYAATALIADSFAATPWAVFTGSESTTKRLDTQPGMVTDPGVKRIDLFSWKFQALASILLRGNAYGQIIATNAVGKPTKIAWLPPDRADIDDDTGEIYFDGKHLERDSVIHVPGYILPGTFKGLSPIGLFRLQFETGMEAQRFGKNFFKRGGVPSAQLKNTQKSLTQQQADTMKKRFVASVSSSEPFVTGADWDYNAISIPAGDIQFLAGIKATANQVAAMYRVPPEDIGGETSGTSLTYKNLEQDMIRFNVRTMRPWTSRFEAVFDRYLVGKQYVRFNLDADARADIKTRYEAHQIALDAGFETLDEVRALEERAPYTDEELAQVLALRQKAAPTQTRSEDA